jgi:hypothetical protein
LPLAFILAYIGTLSMAMQLAAGAIFALLVVAIYWYIKHHKIRKLRLGIKNKI